MIPAQTLYLKGKKVLVFEHKWSDFSEPKGVIISSRKAAGLEKKDIAHLKKLGVKSILVKEGVPLVPILFLGALAAIFLGDPIYLLLG